MLTDHYRGGMTERLLVVVVTVDPSTSKVEVVGKDAAVIQVDAGGRAPALFRWPKQGEYWTIVRENGSWSLQEKVFGPDDKSLSTIAPGEAMLQAEKIWTPSGDYLVKNTQLTAAINALKSAQAYTATGAAADRSFNAGATTINEIAAVLATLINDLKATGIIS